MQTLQSDHEILVIGGGMVGLSAALELQRHGRRVAVLDPCIAQGRASYGNAGVISPGSIFPIASPAIWTHLVSYAAGRNPALRIRYADLPSMAGWLRRFLQHANAQAFAEAVEALAPLARAAYDAHMAVANRIGAAHLITPRGWLRLYRNPPAFDASAGERELLAAHGVDVQVLRGQSIYELEPALQHRFSHALWFTQTAAVDSPGQLLQAYHDAFARKGGLLLEGRALEVAQHGPRVTIATSQGTMQADVVVVAAGAWSGPLAQRLGYRIPLVAERGYHVHRPLVQGPPLTRPIHDAAGAYVVSPMGGGVRVLSGVELAMPGSPADPRQLHAVLRDARRSLAIGNSADPVWMGNRPSTPDSLPVIGFAPRHDRIVFAFGHGHIGLSTGPVTGELVTDLVLKRPPRLPIQAFSPARFG